MPNFLTEIGPTVNKKKSLYQCVCGNQVVRYSADVRAGKHKSCGCAAMDSNSNNGATNHPLYAAFNGLKNKKEWDSFYAFLAEIGTQPFPGAWVTAIVPGTQIRPGNVTWGKPNLTFQNHPNNRTEMHHKDFKNQQELKDLEQQLYVINEEDQNSWEQSLASVRSEFAKYKQDNLEDWQQDIEHAAKDYAIQERHRQERAAIEKGRASQTQVGRLFRYQLAQCCAELMEEWHTTAMNRASGRHLSVVDPVLKKGIDYLTAAHITITVVMDSLGRGTAFQSSLTKVKEDIGRKIDHQAFLNTIEATNPREFDKITRWYLKNGEMGYTYKINNSKRHVPDMPYDFLSKKDCVHLGDWAFTCFERLTKWFEEAKVPNGTKAGYTLYLKLSEEGIKHREILQAVADAAEWDSWPMVCKPLDWTPEQRGGYFMQHPGNISDLIHNDRGTIPSEAAFAAINKQQSIAFKVNEFIYDVQRKLLGTQHEIGAFKAYEKDSWVDENMPRVDPSIWELDKKDPERRKAATKMKLAYGQQKKAEKLAKNPYRVLKTAARFIDVERIYFSCYFDSRLRIYPHSVGLTYQGSDYQKSLLMFADGYEVTEGNAQQVKDEMLISIANTFGKDKLSFADRIAFAADLVKDLEMVAIDPLSTQSKCVWTSADEPFQFLALVREYYELFVWKTKHHTHIPGGRDATNSGNQILGGMCRDAKTCYYTNVIREFNGMTADKPQDLYGVVAEGAKVFLRSDVWVDRHLNKYRKQAQKKADKLGYTINAAFTMNLNPEILTRKHLKRACMIDAYGGSWSSKNEHISDELNDTAAANGMTISLAEKRLVTDACIAAQASEFPLSDALNKWFKNFGKAALEAGLELITWYTPDGSKIVQEYREPNLIEVNTYAMGGGTYYQELADAKGKRGPNRHRAVVQEGYKGEVKEGKTQTALGANFTHSHDSMVIRGAMNAMDTPFFGIHDCLYGPHGTLETACQKLRLSYYETVKPDAFKSLVEVNEVDIEQVVKGNADISVCVDSPYMFS